MSTASDDSWMWGVGVMVLRWPAVMVVAALLLLVFGATLLAVL